MSRRDRISSFGRPSARYAFNPGRNNTDKSTVEPKKTTDTAASEQVTFKPHTLPSRTLNKPNPNNKLLTQKSKVLQRKGLKKLPAYKAKSKIKKKPILITIGASGLFFVMVISSLSIYKFVVRHRQIAKLNIADSPAQQPQQETAVMGAQHNQSWIADQPTMLFIDRMSLTTQITPVGGNDKTLETPSELGNIGWFEGSDKPGSGHAIVLTGRVSGGGMPGALQRINMLGVGDNIQVRTKDGQTYNYKVYKTKNYDIDNLIMKEITNSVIPSREGLNIVTFTDKYDVRVQRFEQRLVVFAVKD